MASTAMLFCWPFWNWRYWWRALRSSVLLSIPMRPTIISATKTMITQSSINVTTLLRGDITIAIINKFFSNNFTFFAPKNSPIFRGAHTRVAHFPPKNYRHCFFSSPSPSILLAKLRHVTSNATITRAMVMGTTQIF